MQYHNRKAGELLIHHSFYTYNTNPQLSNMLTQCLQPKTEQGVKEIDKKNIVFRIVIPSQLINVV